MCEIVKTCHEQGIVLRDLKLRKFVFADKERWVGSAAISAQMLTSALSIRTRSYLMCFARNRAFRRVDVENPLLFRFAKNPHCFLKLIPTWAASEMLFRVLARLLACFFFLLSSFDIEKYKTRRRQTCWNLWKPTQRQRRENERYTLIQQNGLWLCLFQHSSDSNGLT